MKQTDWKIIYTRYDGILKRAINLLSKELSRFLIREPNVYRIYVLPCEKEGCDISKNAFFVGCYNESESIRKHVARDEIPDDGFLVKVIQNPSEPDGRFVILTAHSEASVFYAVVSFLDDYIPKFSPQPGHNCMTQLIFDAPLTECSYSKAPAFHTRSVFTWGHSTNDFRSYIENLARLKINELILWNDYVPLNISEIIEYAHSFGIKVNLGYSWGWIQNCETLTDIGEDTIAKLKDSIVREYEQSYAHTKCDGIYFQSFTERNDETIGGRLIAEAVTELVNTVSAKILEKYPTLKLQFGLHATSVYKHLDKIEQIDPRVEIMWENCGEFPYNYYPFSIDSSKYEETLEFTQKLLGLRGGVGVGLVYKGMVTLDWTRFVHQSGPYVLGENAPEIAEHDRHIRRSAWRSFSTAWIRNGEYAQKMAQYINKYKSGKVNMCMAGTLDGGIYIPMALCAEMFYTCNEEYRDLLHRVTARPYVTAD